MIIKLIEAAAILGFFAFVYVFALFAATKLESHRRFFVVDRLGMLWLLFGLIITAWFLFRGLSCG